MHLHALNHESLRAQIRRVAARLRKHRAFARETLPDIEQALLLGVQARLPGYRPEKGPIEAFVKAAAWSAARTLARDATRAKRDPGRLVSVDAMRDAADLHDPLVGLDPQRLERNDAVRAALATLDPADRAVAEDIVRLGQSGARHRSGLGRSQWAQAKKRIGLALRLAIDGDTGAFSCAHQGNGVSH